MKLSVKMKSVLAFASLFVSGMAQARVINLPAGGLTGTPTDLSAEVAAAKALYDQDQDPVTIVLAPLPDGATYSVPTEIVIKWPLVVRGSTGNAADVTIAMTRNGTDTTRNFYLQHEDARIQSFTITNGLVGAGTGGGTTAASKSGMLRMTHGVVSNVVITACEQSGKGMYGIVQMLSGDALVTHCMITNCTAAPAWDSGNPDHGMFLDVAGGCVRNCLIAGNSVKSPAIPVGKPVADGSLPAVAVSGGCIVGCTIADIKGSQNERVCAGVYVGANGKLVNTLIARTSTTSTVRPHYGTWTGTADNLVNCALGCEEQDLPNATCVQVGDPFLEGTYQLVGDSGCVDAGTTDSAYEYGVTDLAGVARMREKSGVLTIDIGAYQFDSTAAKFSATMTVPEKLAFDRDEFAFTVSVDGALTDDPTFYWDFDSDGTVDLVTKEMAFTRTFTTGVYQPSVAASNGAFTVGMDYAFDDSSRVEILPHPVHYVNVNGTNPVSPFTTPETAATDIQSALDVAVPHAEVVIDPGTYNVSKSLKVTNDYLTVYGSTGKPEDVIVHALNDSVVGTTTVGNRCMDIDAGVHTVVHSMTFENGRGGTGRNNYGTHVTGGCLNIARFTGTSTETGDNVSSGNGGMVSNCVIRGGSVGVNYSAVGGAFLVGANAFMTHCVLSNNTNSGGTYNSCLVGASALYLWSGAKAENCLITGNTGKTAAFKPAVQVGKDSVLRYSTVISNKGMTVGGVNVSDTGCFEKCVIAGNTAGEVAKLSGMTAPHLKVWGAVDGGYLSNYSYNDDKAPQVIANELTKSAEVRADMIYNGCDLIAPEEAEDPAEYTLGAGSVYGMRDALVKQRRDGSYKPMPLVRDLVAPGEEQDMATLDLQGQHRLYGAAYDIGCFEYNPKGLMLLIR